MPKGYSVGNCTNNLFYFFYLTKYRCSSSLKKSAQSVPPCPSKTAKYPAFFQSKHLSGFAIFSIIDTLSQLYCLIGPWLVHAEQHFTRPFPLAEYFGASQFGSFIPFDLGSSGRLLWVCRIQRLPKVYFFGTTATYQRMMSSRELDPREGDFDLALVSCELLLLLLYCGVQENSELPALPGFKSESLLTIDSCRLLENDLCIVSPWSLLLLGLSIGFSGLSLLSLTLVYVSLAVYSTLSFPLLSSTRVLVYTELAFSGLLPGVLARTLTKLSWAARRVWACLSRLFDKYMQQIVLILSLQHSLADFLHYGAPIGMVVVRVDDLQVLVLRQQLFQLALFEDVVVSFVDHRVLLLVDLLLFDLCLFLLLQFLLALILETEVPRHEYILLCELPLFLFHGPHINQPLSANSQYPHQLRYGLMPKRIAGEMVYDCYRQKTVKNARPHRQPQRISSKQLKILILLQCRIQQSFAPISPNRKQIFTVDTNVFAIATAHIKHQGAWLDIVDELLDLRPSFVAGVAEVLGDFVVDIIDVFLLQLGWLTQGFASLGLVLLEQLLLLVGFHQLLFVGLAFLHPGCCSFEQLNCAFTHYNSCVRK